MKPYSMLLALVGCSHTALEPDVSGDAAADATTQGVTAVSLTGCSWSFTGTFDVGGSPFRLEIDTGSNVLAVAGHDCTTCSSAGVHALYTPSNTAVDEHMPVTATYDGGDISWSGSLFEDDVAVGGTSVRLELASISTQQRFFQGQCGSPDGIIGLAGSGPASLMTELASTGVPDRFAMHNCVSHGMLWLGGYDAAAATAPPVYAPLTVGVSSYEVPVTDFSVGGTSIGLPATTYGPAIVDSGGPTIIVPSNVYNAITAAIANNAVFNTTFGDATWFAGGTNSCVRSTATKAELDAQLPTLTVRIGMVEVAMAATDSYLLAYSDPGGRYYCPAIATEPSFFDLGNSLIRSQLVIFDRAGKQMGFAATPPCTD